MVLIFPNTFFQFMQDASDVMQLLLKTQTDFSDMEDDDPQVKQLSHVCRDPSSVKLNVLKKRN